MEFNSTRSRTVGFDNHFNINSKSAVGLWNVETSTTALNAHFYRPLFPAIPYENLPSSIFSERTIRSLSHKRQILFESPLYNEFLFSISLTSLSDLYPDEWLETTKEKFTNLSTPENIHAFAKKATYAEICHILRLAQSQDSLHANLPYFLVSLSYQQIASTLFCMDEDQLYWINTILRKSKEKKTSTFKSYFTFLRQDAANYSNRIRNEIDDLCEKSRKVDVLSDNAEDCQEQITLSSLVQKISLVSEAIRHHQIISKKIKLLFCEVICDAESISLILDKTSHLDRSYEIHAQRLGTNDRLLKSSEALGCPRAILYRRAIIDRFIATGDDEESQKITEEILREIEEIDHNEAIDIFSSWGISSLEDWRAIGLLGNISDEEFASYSNYEGIKNGSGYKKGMATLERMGITQIQDLCTHNIFSKELLFDAVNKFNRQNQS